MRTLKEVEETGRSYKSATPTVTTVIQQLQVMAKKKEGAATIKPEDLYM